MAQADLSEALDYARSERYRLYESDIRVGLGWMQRAAGNLEAARTEVAAAKQMSEAMGYHWGVVVATELLELLD